MKIEKEIVKNNYGIEEVKNNYELEEDEKQKLIE